MSKMRVSFENEAPAPQSIGQKCGTRGNVINIQGGKSMAQKT